MPSAVSARSARWSIPVALSFELWKVAGMWLLLVPLINFAWLAAVYTLLAYVGVRDFRGTEHGAWLHMAMLGVVCMMACAIGVPMVARGRPEWRNTRPVSTMTLVVCDYFNCVVASLVNYALMALCVNLAFDAGWTLLAPSLLIVAAVAVGIMVRFLFERSPFLQIFVGGACWFAAMGWLVTRFGISLTGDVKSTVHAWPVPSLGDLAVLGSATAVALVAASIGARINRSGSGPSLAWLEPMLDDLSTRRRAVDRTFTTPFSALLWFEWKTRGRPLIIAVTVLTSIFVLWTCSPMVGVENATSVSEAFIAIATIACCGFGAVVGLRSEGSAMRSFEATRPVSDTRAAIAIVINSIIAVAIAAVTCMVGYYLVVARYSLVNATFFILDPFVDVLPVHPALTAGAVMVLAAIAGWAVMGVVAAAVLSSKTSASTLLYLYMLACMVAFIMIQQGLGYQAKAVANYYLCESQGVVAAVYTIVVLVWSTRKRLLSVRTTGVLFAVGCVAATTGALLLRTRLPVLAAGIGMLLVASPGAFSLALFYNRHR